MKRIMFRDNDFVIENIIYLKEQFEITYLSLLKRIIYGINHKEHKVNKTNHALLECIKLFLF